MLLPRNPDGSLHAAGPNKAFTCRVNKNLLNTGVKFIGSDLTKAPLAYKNTYPVWNFRKNWWRWSALSLLKLYEGAGMKSLGSETIGFLQDPAF